MKMCMTFCIFSFFVFIGVTSGNGMQCGHRALPPQQSNESHFHPLISGGSTVPNIGKWPWLAFLRSDAQNSTATCTASIVSERYLLTAAHCDLLNMLTKLGLFNLTLDANITVRVGSVNSTSGGTVHRVKQLIRQNGYGTVLVELDANDIALIELEEPLHFNHNVRPICLSKHFDQEQEAARNESALIAGWGQTVESDVVECNATGECQGFVPQLPDKTQIQLQEGRVQLLPMAVCNRSMVESLKERQMNVTDTSKMRQQLAALIQNQLIALANISEQQFEQAKRGLPMLMPEQRNMTKEDPVKMLEEKLALVQNGTDKALLEANLKDELALVAFLFEKFGPELICANGPVSNVEMGDSGGPLMVQENGTIWQVGITHAILTRSKQDAHKPSIFVALAPHCAWIAKMTKGTVQCRE